MRLMLKNKKERVLRFVGKWIVTPFFAIGSAMLTTVAIASLSFIVVLPLAAIIAILTAVFVAETVVSVYLFKNSVPETLVSLFTQNVFKQLSTTKKIVLGLGLFSALGAGLSIAALTYTSGIAAVTAILGLASISFPPLGIVIASVLAVMGFIAISGLFIKWISHAVRNDVHKQIAHFFKSIFQRDKSKLLMQQVLEGSFKLLFTTAIVVLTAVGTVATLGTMQVGLMKFLTLIPQANMLAVKIASSIIAFGLMGAARLPWALQSVCSVFATLGEMTGRILFKAGLTIAKKLQFIKSQDVVLTTQQKDANETKFTAHSVLEICAKMSAVLIHSFSFGALANSGGGKILSNMITNLDSSLSPSDVHTSAEITAIVTAGSMQVGISAYPLFFSPSKPPQQADEDCHKIKNNDVNSFPLDDKSLQSEPHMLSLM